MDSVEICTIEYLQSLGDLYDGADEDPACLTCKWAANRIIELTQALTRTAIKYRSSPNGMIMEYMCKLCGAGNEKQENLLHTPDCLLYQKGKKNEQSP